jgi:hypothetical protein
VAGEKSCVHVVSLVQKMKVTLYVAGAAGHHPFAGDL